MVPAFFGDLFVGKEADWAGVHASCLPKNEEMKGGFFKFSRK
jgi:hypothetical protein